MDPDGDVADANRAFGVSLGRAVEAIVGRPPTEFLAVTETDRMKQWIGGAPLPDDFVAFRANPDSRSSVGADGYGRDLRDAVRAADELVPRGS